MNLMADIMKLIAALLVAVIMFIVGFAAGYLLVSASGASNVQNEQVVIKFSLLLRSRGRR